jgi:diacylglycerol kinase
MIITRSIRRFLFAAQGLRRALAEDFSFQTQWYGGIGVTALLTLWAWPLTATEGLALAGALALVWITELQNSSIEIALDHLHPETHERIGYAKDLAAAAVLGAGVFYGIVCVAIIATRIL